MQYGLFKSASIRTVLSCVIAWARGPPAICTSNGFSHLTLAEGYTGKTAAGKLTRSLRQPLEEACEAELLVGGRSPGWIAQNLSLQEDFGLQEGEQSGKERRS
jgi:hypothetical protein